MTHRDGQSVTLESIAKDVTDIKRLLTSGIDGRPGTIEIERACQARQETRWRWVYAIIGFMAVSIVSLGASMVAGKWSGQPATLTRDDVAKIIMELDPNN